MARGPEGKFKTRVDDKLPPEIHHQPMGALFSNGTPDRYYEGPVSELWVEYKWLAKPKIFVPIDLLTPLQKRWVRRAAQNRRPVWIVVGSPTGAAVAMPEDWDGTWSRLSLTLNDAAVALMIEDLCKGHIKTKYS